MFSLYPTLGLAQRRTNVWRANINWSEIVKLEVKRPVLKGREYNKIQWSTTTHHPPKLISLANYPRKTQNDLRLTQDDLRK